MKRLFAILTILILAVNSFAQEGKNGYIETANMVEQTRIAASHLEAVACGTTTAAIASLHRSALPSDPLGAGTAAIQDYRQISGLLQNERQKLNAIVSARFPGSSFDCVDRRGKIVDGNQEYLYDRGELKQFSERADLTYSIGFNAMGALVAVSDGRQSISFIVDRSRPEQSSFNEVQLTVSANSSQSRDVSGSMVGMYDGSGVKGSYGRGFNVGKNEMIAHLNNLYRGMSEKGTMTAFAATLILDPEFRNGILDEIAELETSQNAAKQQMKGGNTK